MRRSCNGGAPPPRKIDMPIADCDMTDGPPPRVPPNGVVPGREPATVSRFVLVYCRWCVWETRGPPGVPRAPLVVVGRWPGWPKRACSARSPAAFAP